MILHVTYDLHGSDRDYDPIHKVLKTADSWMHPEGSVWFLDTLDSTSTWRDRLKSAGKSDDEFFVIRLAHDWASVNSGKIATDWLKDSARRW